MSIQVEPKASLERSPRRRFSGAQRQRLLAEFDALLHGEKGAWLRREGLYAGQLGEWRKARTAGGESLEPKTVGRKSKDAKDVLITQLQADKAKLEKRVVIAEGLLDLQKKMFALMGAKQSENVS
jgi:transposase